MPQGDTLTPREALYIASNAYFTLENWINREPVAGTESRVNIQNRVLGPGDVGLNKAGDPNPTLKGTKMSDAKLGQVYSAVTGLSTTSGFGYTLTYRGNGLKHVVVALRGTRPEMAGKPDLLTDLRAAMAAFGDFGPVHKGFKKTFDSVLPKMERDHKLIKGADVVHCVGHSLGGAVATLVAAHYARQGQAVKLYTFGSPRVGALGTYAAFHERIGKSNIYRVAHDLDPISLIAPYPYIHVNPSPRDPNNMTLPSPTGSLFSTANHDMVEYIRSIGSESMSWETVRGLASQVDHDESVLARWLLYGNNSEPGWVQYASEKTLGILFKLFSHVLRHVSTSLILGLSAVDLLTEMLLKGYYKSKQLGEPIYQLLKYAAEWAGVTVTAGVDFTAQMIRNILAKMLSALQYLATRALDTLDRNIVPLTLGIGGAWILASYGLI